MNTQFVLDHLGRVFCFWLVWKLLDLGWHLFDVQMFIDTLAGRKDAHVVNIMKMAATKDDQAKLAKGVAEIYIKLEMVKKQVASIAAKQVADNPAVTAALLEEKPVPSKKRGRKMGVSKLEPIPFADEPVKERKGEVQTHRKNMLKIAAQCRPKKPGGKRMVGM